MFFSLTPEVNDCENPDLSGHQMQHRNATVLIHGRQIRTGLWPPDLGAKVSMQKREVPSIVVTPVL